MIPSIIRYVLTMALLYGAYTETGIWTTVSLLLLFIGFEVQGQLDRRRHE